MFIPFAKLRIQSSALFDDFCFNLTQLLFLADHDIAYWQIETQLLHCTIDN